MDLDGKLIANRYEIIKKVGNGGMATVYKAKDNVLNRFVAVKILRDEFTTDQEFIKRFEVEAQSAASITHPNIVSVYDVGNVDGNLYYIVMELIQGKTLKEIILEEGGPLPWKWSVNIAIQIASALEVAHKNHIVHRDIKPHNIIITEDGIAKVTDFGIAKAVSNSTITAFGKTIGSVHYFSPEHARGGYTDAKSDLYSLGVVMYEMLTGRLPFDADTPVSVALKHMQEEPEEPIEINEKVPSAVNDIIMKALRKDTNLRYASATAMLKDLNLALKDPEGDFVDREDNTLDFATQRISTLYDEDDLEQGNRKKKKKKDNKFVAWIKKHKKLSAFLGLILLFFLSFGGTWAFAELTSPKVEIPELVGVELEEAKTQVETLNNENEKINITIEVASEEYNEEYAAGYIISQDPESHTKIKQDTTIRVVVSKGIETVTVPKVTGIKQDEAQKTLEELGLKVEIVEESSKKVEAGYVIEQDIKEGTEVNTGDTITLKVSLGTEKVTVPAVVGNDEETAKKTLTKAGLSVTVAYEEDSSKDNGVVLRQSIDAGKEVSDGSNITITVNKVAESKSATININVSSITGGYSTADDTLDDNEKKVTVKLSVDGTTAFTQSGVDKNRGSMSTTITGKGSVNLSLEIKDNNGGEWTRSYTLNLNNESSYTFN